MLLESFIREEARRLGFAAVGFAAAGPSRSFDRFRQWLDQGYAAGMTWLSANSALRAQPALLAPYVKTIIVAAARYPSGRSSGPWSNYALGRDYHDVLRGRLKALAEAIRGQMDAPLRSRVCVDSAPIMEREWACRAGLGWIGRQGSLVHPELGCCLFLGELLTDLELEESPPAAGGCGDCRLCVEACPAGAIQADGLVDARRCVSYLTIEHKGDIPTALRPAVGTMLFGCDRCTAVCPRNPSPADAANGILPEFSAANQPLPAPEECLAMTESDFERRFAGSAVLRLGLARLQRNAAVVRENQKSR